MYTNATLFSLSEGSLVGKGDELLGFFFFFFLSLILFLQFLLPVADEMSYGLVLKEGFKASPLIFPAGMDGVSSGFPRRASNSCTVILGISV